MEFPLDDQSMHRLLLRFGRLRRYEVQSHFLVLLRDRPREHGVWVSTLCILPPAAALEDVVLWGYVALGANMIQKLANRI